MAKFEKEKNILMVYVDGKEKPYKIDIEKGIVYGIKGNPVKTTPAGMPSAFSSHCANSTNLIKLMYIIHERYGVKYANFSSWVKYLIFWDKVDSLNSGKLSTNTWEMTNEKYVQFANDHFKDYAKWIVDKNTLSLEKFYNECAFAIWCKKYNVYPNEYISVDILRSIMTNASVFNSKEKIKYALYQAQRGLFEFGYSYSYSFAIERLSNYFKYCKALEKEYEKGDFIKAYVGTRRQYLFRKKELDNKRLFNNQSKHKEALTFSYGNLETIIPLTCDEFHEEAEAQHNCVESMYLEQVIDGRTNVVFVRQKNEPNKSYITCEVRNGQIRQFLLKYNRRVTEDIDNEFRKEFQNYLNSMWS